MLQRLKKWMLPLAMITGAIFYRYVELLSPLTPYLIFSMLLITYCKLSLRNMNISPLHAWLLGIQIFGSLIVYGILYFLDPLVAQGTFICIICPTATAAAVITGMLGGDIACLATYSLLSNMAVAITSPVIFSFLGTHGSLPFLDSFWIILKQMVPLLILPFVCAIALQRFFPKIHSLLQNRQSISFYMWAVALTIVMGRTVSFIVKQGSGDYKEELLIALFALIVCVLQFIIGKYIGSKYYNTIAGGQGLGQKNTVLAIWMALTYLNPLASIGPASYVVWQNSINSAQLWFKEKRDRKTKA
ncbi:bile acid:sodium symporter family protein [Coprobacter tertius]|uniref:Transporter n=1 Tax=Coprobacter tertius TaxID=2944915 RepID=A0ABT1MJ55_9BACT|nr:transporter [Coprobacter tertius]